MRIAKKAFLILCALLFLTSTVAAVQPTATVSLSADTVRPKRSVEVSVTLDGNPGLAAWMFRLSWDKDVMQLQSGEAVRSGEAFRSGTMMADAGDGTLAITWFAADNNTNNGEMFTVTFELLAEAANGTYPVTLQCSAENTINAQEQEVALETRSASITVTGGKSPTAADSGKTTPGKTTPDKEGPENTGNTASGTESSSPAPEAADDALIMVQQEDLEQLKKAPEDAGALPEQTPLRRPAKFILPASAAALGAGACLYLIIRNKNKNK